MNYLKKLFAPLDQRCVRETLVAIALTGVAVSAQAGGLDTGKQGLSTLQIWLYACAAIVAALYLIKEGITAFKAGGDWVHDFGMSCVKVFVCGGAVVLAGWLFSAGGS